MSAVKNLVVVLVTLTSITTHAKEVKMSSDEKKIRETIQTYVDGYLNADKTKVGSAFNGETVLYSVDEGKVDKTEMKDWFQNLDQRKSKGDLRHAKLEIKMIDITENAAIAKIELHFEKMQFTDYLSLLNVNHVWTIFAKIYSVKSISN